MKKIFHLMTIGAIACTVMFLGSTGVGQAFKGDWDQPVLNKPSIFHQIKKDNPKFLAKKAPAYMIVDLTIEGMTEKVRLDRQIGTDGKYAIYVDLERYQFIHGDDGDQIRPITQLPEEYPDVSILINHRPTQTPEQSIEKVMTDLHARFQTVSAPVKVKSPLNAWMIRASSGTNYNSPITKVYIVKDAKKGSYILTKNYFLVAEEGHGVRFDSMLKYFTVLKK